ncbi:MAG: hypothetical protein ABIV26_07625, partial [Candidatus Limnocylindrales bacterium]
RPMNEEHRVQEDHPGAEELALHLDAYASARLAPDRMAIARMRAALVEEARMRALQAEIAVRHARFWPRRRAVSLLLAAALTLGSAVAVLAAGAPGGPLYGARIWFESALLPANADARAMERVHQVEERIADAERAAAAGDSNGVAAAIRAYRDAVQAALMEAGTDAARLDRIRLALGLHVTVLETLAGMVPDAASDGIAGAIEASQQAADRIQHGRPPVDRGAEPTAPVVDPTAKPARTPDPGASGKPARTPGAKPTVSHSQPPGQAPDTAPNAQPGGHDGLDAGRPRG